MKWSPEKVILQSYGNTTKELRKKLLVRGLDANEAARLKAEPLESWIRVEGQDVTGNIIQMRLVFDPSAMPERIDQGILRLCLDDGPCETVQGYGKR